MFRFKTLFENPIMVFVRLVSVVVREQAIWQTVRRAMFDHARATSPVVGTRLFRTTTFLYVFTLHSSFS